MIALLTLLIVVTVTILIGRIATRALVLTGLSEDMARLQSRSALTGTGFTTDESEHVVNHPARRRILRLLMLVQNAGLVAIISTFILSFIGTGTAAETLQRGAVLVVGLVVLALLAQSAWVDRRLSRLIEWSLKRYTTLNMQDYATMLHVREGYKVVRFEIREDAWLAGKTLREADLPEEGVAVLSITRADDTATCIPRGAYTLHAHDILVLYGREERLAELKRRRAGAPGEVAREAAEDEQDLHQAQRGRGTASVRRKTPPADAAFDGFERGRTTTLIR